MEESNGKGGVARPREGAAQAVALRSISEAKGPLQTSCLAFQARAFREPRGFTLARQLPRRAVSRKGTPGSRRLATR